LWMRMCKPRRQTEMAEEERKRPCPALLSSPLPRRNGTLTSGKHAPLVRSDRPAPSSPRYWGSDLGYYTQIFALEVNKEFQPPPVARACRTQPTPERIVSAHVYGGPASRNASSRSCSLCT
jgi:hypothetical protein